MNNNTLNAVVLGIVFVLVVLTLGDPDILDGLIKRANS